MGRRTPGRETLRKSIPIFKCSFMKNNIFGLQTLFFDGFNVLMSFLAQKWCRTVMKSSQKASFGTKTCKILIFSCNFPILFLGPNLDRAPTRTGPQPGLGPNPGPGPCTNQNTHTQLCLLPFACMGAPSHFCHPSVCLAHASHLRFQRCLLGWP